MGYTLPGNQMKQGQQNSGTNQVLKFELMWYFENMKKGVNICRQDNYVLSSYFYMIVGINTNTYHL